MQGSGRNASCRCGSGRKAKRCCGTRRGPGPAELAKAFLAGERRRAVSVLVCVDRDEFDGLFDEMLDLPTVDVSLQVDLPRLLGPELERLREAIADGDDDAYTAAVGPAVASLDGPERRVALLEAALALSEAGRVDARVAAVAAIDLAGRRSALFRSSLVEALAVSVGAARTPAGLLVVSG